MTAPSDPVCPECGEPVGATSQYCMHCDSEFEAPVDAAAGPTAGASARSDAGASAGGDGSADSEWGDSDEAVTEHPSGWDEGGPGDAGHTKEWADTERGGADATTDSAAATTGAEGAPNATATGSDAGGFDVLQFGARVLAVLMVVVVGILTTFTLMAVTSEVASLWLPLMLVSFLGIITAGVLIARQDSGIDALADALYVTAAALVGLPIAFFLFVPSGDPIVERLVAGVFFAVFASFVAGPLFVVGWWLQPDDE